MIMRDVNEKVVTWKDVLQCLIVTEGEGSTEGVGGDGTEDLEVRDDRGRDSDGHLGGGQTVLNDTGERDIAGEDRDISLGLNEGLFVQLTLSTERENRALQGKISRQLCGLLTLIGTRAEQRDVQDISVVLGENSGSECRTDDLSAEGEVSDLASLDIQSGLTTKADTIITERQSGAEDGLGTVGLEETSGEDVGTSELTLNAQDTIGTCGERLLTIDSRGGHGPVQLVGEEARTLKLNLGFLVEVSVGFSLNGDDTLLAGGLDGAADSGLEDKRGLEGADRGGVGGLHGNLAGVLLAEDIAGRRAELGELGRDEGHFNQ